MKKLCVTILSCFMLLCTSCKKEDFVSNTYRASFEYHIADANNQQAVTTMMNNWDAVWTSEIELTLINTYTTDLEAKTKFATSVIAVNSKRNSWKSFLGEQDYMIYSLTRTTPGNEKTIRQVQFDKDGHFSL